MAAALITGSNGFIGSHLAEFLIRKGMDVHCMVRPASDLRWLEALPVKRVIAGLSDKESLESACRNMDYIFHLAGKTKASTRKAFFDANETGTQNLLDAVCRVSPGIKRFIYVSSQAAGGPSHGLEPRNESDPPAPVTWYGESKLAGEKAVMNTRDRLPVTIIRPPSVYGPRDTDVFEVFQAVNYHFKPVLGFRPRYASFIYIQDLVRGLYLAAISAQAAGELYYMNSDQAVSWPQLNDTAARHTGKWAITVHIPVGVLWLTALAREIQARITGVPSIINLQKMNEFRERFWICDGSRAKTQLGFQPEVPLEEGVSRTIRWYREHHWL